MSSIDPREERTRGAIHPSDARVNPNIINTSWTYKILNFRPADWLTSVGWNPWQPRTLDGRKPDRPMPRPDSTQLRQHVELSHQPLDETTSVLNSSNMSNKITNPYV